MTDITKAFYDYKRIHGALELEAEINIPVDLQFKDNLAGIINEFEFTQYDAKEYNSAFSKMLERGKKNAGFIYDAMVYNRYFKELRHMDRIPETTLQIGPGGSQGCEVLFSLMGVKKAYSLDPFLMLTFDLDGYMKLLKLLFETMTLFKGVGGYDPQYLNFPDCEKLETGHYTIGDNTVRHFDSRTFDNTGFESDSIDYLFSHATLEHVKDPLKCIQETSRVVKPGGLTAHCIDLRDHRNFEDPLGFLCESGASWEEIMNEYCSVVPHGYMNRWRASEYRDAFESEGFEVLEHFAEIKASDEVIETVTPYLDEKYRALSQEDLKTTTLFIVARKV